MSTDKPKNHRKVITYLVIALIGMFGFCFALVPLYNTFCKVTGLNGKTGGRTREIPPQMVDKTRSVTVEFVTSAHDPMHWDFYPLQRQVKLHPGEMRQVAFYAKNNTGHTMVGQAIPSVSPGEAARYLKKTECFCFTEQTLHAKEGRNMPLRFFLDPDLPKEIHRLTLSYTLFDKGAPSHDSTL